MNHGIKCERCGTVDDRGPHTADNCAAALTSLLATTRKELVEVKEMMADATIHICALDDLIAGQDDKLDAAITLLQTVRNCTAPCHEMEVDCDDPDGGYGLERREAIDQFLAQESRILDEDANKTAQ